MMMINEKKTYLISYKLINFCKRGKIPEKYFSSIFREQKGFLDSLLYKKDIPKNLGDYIF